MTAITTLNFFKVNASPEEMNSPEGFRKKRAHAVATAWVVKNGEYVSTIVLDYYTPKNAAPGWYVAFRRPGFVHRQHPAYRVFIGQDIFQLTRRDIYLALDEIAKKHIDYVDFNKSVFTSDWRNSQIMNY